MVAAAEGPDRLKQGDKSKSRLLALASSAVNLSPLSSAAPIATYAFIIRLIKLLLAGKMLNVGKFLW